jgi:hypothetical protein
VPLILVLLLSVAQAHMVTFPHAMELTFAEEHVDVTHQVRIHPGDAPAWLGPFPADDMAKTSRMIGTRQLKAGPVLRYSGKKAKCKVVSIEGDALRGSMNVRLKQRCERPSGELKVSVSGVSPWTKGLVPISVLAPVLEPTLEGAGQALAGRGDGPWVGAVAGDAELRFVLRPAPVKLPGGESI